LKTAKTRNPIGWGYIEEAVTDKESENVLAGLSDRFDFLKLKQEKKRAASEIKLSPCRAVVPASLKSIVAITHEERLLHAVGRSFRDLATIREQPILPAPDAVAVPQSFSDLERILEWAYMEGLAIIPFGGGSSVVGGINPEGMDSYPGIVTVDLRGMNRVLDISPTERIVHAEAGIFGPDLDIALQPHSLVVRHMPQSYEHSTLGGWIASRGAGHNSTLHTKIEDRVQSLDGILSDGRRFSTRPIPATSVGIDPRSYWAGSEGALGFITSARLRVYHVPKFRGFRGFSFPSFEQALEGARQIAQSDLFPVQLRLLDRDENAQTARLANRPGNGQALMILADESTLPVVEGRLDILSQIAKDCGGVPDESASKLLRAWIRLFFRQPYMRDFIMDWGIVIDTFETSITWDRAVAFYHEIIKVSKASLQRVCGGGHVGCRATHSYTDGVCLYFSFYAPAGHGNLLSCWHEIKNEVSEAVVRGGGTISHHHAMGRDHKPYAKKEFPEIHRAAVRDLRRSLDPKGLMNPGLWFDD